MTENLIEENTESRPTHTPDENNKIDSGDPDEEVKPRWAPQMKKKQTLFATIRSFVFAVLPVLCGWWS